MNHATTTSTAVGSPVEYVQTSLTGARLSSPINGTVVAWSVRGTILNGPSNFFNLRVLRPSGSDFTFVDRSEPNDFPNGFTDDAVRRIATSLPIRAGDTISLHGATNSRLPLASTGGALYETFSGLGNDGEPSGPPTGTGLAGEAQFNAEVEPTNSFTLSAAQANKKAGTATLTATLPNPGTLTVQGATVRSQTLTPSAEGPQGVTLSPTKKTQKRLRKKGKASGAVDFTFTPSFGVPLTQSVSITLRLKRKPAK